MRSQQIRNLTHICEGGNGEHSLKIKFAAVNADKNSTATLISAVASKKLRVIGGHVEATAGDGTATFKSSSTAITGVIPLWKSATGGASGPSLVGLDFGPDMQLETTAGEALKVTLSTNADMDGWLMYVEIPG